MCSAARQIAQKTIHFPMSATRDRVRVRREKTSMVTVSLENILRGLKLTSGRRGKSVVVEHILTESALGSDLESSSKFIDFRLERGGTPPFQIPNVLRLEPSAEFGSDDGRPLPAESATLYG